MRQYVAAVLSCLYFLAASAHDSTDPLHPIDIGANTIIYDGDVIKLGERCLFVDGALTDDEARLSPWIYKDFNEAMQHLVDGTEDAPMQVFIAPWVYWIDNPDDEAVRIGKDGQ